MNASVPSGSSSDEYDKEDTDAGFKPEQAAFLTAFQSRGHAAFKKVVATLAWGSFAWCFSEPEHLIAFDGMAPGGVTRLRDFQPCQVAFTRYVKNRWSAERARTVNGEFLI